MFRLSFKIHLTIIIYICKTQIDIKIQIDVQSSNPCLISMSQLSVPQMSMAISHFLKSTSNDVTDICPNPNL